MSQKEAKEAIAKPPVNRVRRSSIAGRRNVLTVSGQDPDFHYRVVNDSGDRVQEFIDMGYGIVEKDSVRIGDKRVDNQSGEGSQARVSVGQGMHAYVMRIRKDWYQEDQAAKQAHVDATEAATKEKALDGTYGKLEISRS
jgi:hypothetical protein